MLGAVVGTLAFFLMALGGLLGLLFFLFGVLCFALAVCYLKMMFSGGLSG